MEKKSLVLGAAATLFAMGAAFTGLATANAVDSTPSAPAVVQVTPTETATPATTETPTVTPTPTPEPAAVTTEAVAPAPVEQPAPAPVVEQPAPAPAPAVVQPAPAPATAVDKDGYITDGTSGGGSAGPGKVDLSTPPADGSKVILNPTAGDVVAPQPAPSAGK